MSLISTYEFLIVKFAENLFSEFGPKQNPGMITPYCCKLLTKINLV